MAVAVAEFVVADHTAVVDHKAVATDHKEPARRGMVAPAPQQRPAPAREEQPKKRGQRSAGEKMPSALERCSARAIAGITAFLLVDAAARGALGQGSHAAWERAAGRAEGA